MKLIEKGPWVAIDSSRPSRGRKRPLRYKARFWEGPIEAGKNGHHHEQVCDDWLYEQPRTKPDGSTYLHRGFLNTAASVSYHSDLMRQALK